MTGSFSNMSKLNKIIFLSIRKAFSWYLLALIVTFGSLEIIPVANANQNNVYLSHPTSSVSSYTSEKKNIVILAIDGGGIRGIIPAIILKELESRLKPGKHLVDCFDVISGTSTGGIIALLLATPDKSGKPRYKADDIIHMYENLGSKVFRDSIWQKIKSGLGWFGAKYSHDALEELMDKYFEETELKDMLTNVMVPAYEIERDHTFFFRTSKAKQNESRNFRIKDIARATSAAPTYFEPTYVSNMTGDRTRMLVDGGISVNNPALSATVHAYEIFGDNEKFVIISLGTGTTYGSGKKAIEGNDVQKSGLLGWAKKIIPTMMHAINNLTNYQMDYVFNRNSDPKDNYYRLQAILDPKHSEMDDASFDNLNALKEYAEQVIKENNAVIDEIAAILNED
jgi:uncharacterized protein